MNKPTINDEARIKHAQEADADALQLLKIIEPMDRIPMEEYLEANLPRIPVIAALAFVAMEEKKNRIKAEKVAQFLLARQKGTDKKKDDAAEARTEINKINALLLAKPANEGWGYKTKRVYEIFKTLKGTSLERSESYISRLIAKPRNTNQT